MLKNIKSTYILKMVLFHLEEVLKLELVKYNKSFQKKIDLSIKNYKEFTKRYIIYSSKTSGIEYNENGKLLYKGNFLKGKRSGMGRDYNSNGALIFFKRKKMEWKSFFW